VVEAKAQLIAIQDRVSVDGGNAASDNVTTTPVKAKQKLLQLILDLKMPLIS
jgi:hypothetical protein